MAPGRFLLLVAVGGLLLTTAACGGSSPSPTAGATPHASATATASPSSTPSPTPTPSPRPLELMAPTVGIDVVATSTPCDASLLSLLPSGTTVHYADCGGYVVFLAAAGGPLDALISAPADTTVRWLDASSNPFHTQLVAGVSTLPRDPATGQYTGHGVGGPTAFFQVRDASQARERGGPISAG